MDAIPKNAAMSTVTVDDLEHDYERVREMASGGPVSLAGGDLVVLTREGYERLRERERVACHPADLPDAMLRSLDETIATLESAEAPTE